MDEKQEKLAEELISEFEQSAHAEPGSSSAGEVPSEEIQKGFESFIQLIQVILATLEMLLKVDNLQLNESEQAYFFLAYQKLYNKIKNFEEKAVYGIVLLILLKRVWTVYATYKQKAQESDASKQDKSVDNQDKDTRFL